MNNLPSVAPVEHKYTVEPTVSAAGKAFKDTANFTKKLALFEVCPFLLGGILFASGTPKNDIGQLFKGIGGMMIVASPLILLLKCLALPVLAGSAAATAATGIAYGVDKLSTKLSEPSEAEKQRIEHTQHFVQRMKDFLNNYTPEQRADVEKNPGSLISLSLLTVVFLSRRLDGDQIKDGDSVIQKSDVAKMDAHAQDYFDKVCKMKSYLKDLSLSPEDGLAWEYLTQSIQNFYNKKDSLQPSEQATLETMIKECDALSSLIIQDDIFQTAWKKA
jgi:hypothetical protein